MDFKDYYEILGVPPDADANTIKQAYRKLARQHHPDVNPGNKESEEKFKTINEAYQVLSNPEQRKKYDEVRAQYERWQQSGRNPRDFNWQSWAAQPGQEANVSYGTPEDFQDLFGGESPFSDFFSTIFGQAQGHRAPSGSRRGQDVEAIVELSLEEAYRGADRTFQIGDRRIEARIPPGVRTGSRVRLSGQGEPGRNGGPAGDIYLMIRLLPHPTFELEGDDLYTKVSLDFYTAALGGEAHVPTLDRPLILKIPPNTQADRTFRIRGKGMPKPKEPNVRGDLYARARIVLPENMTEQELNALRELAETRNAGQSV